MRGELRRTNTAWPARNSPGCSVSRPAGWSAEALTHNAHIAVTAGIWRDPRRAGLLRPQGALSRAGRRRPGSGALRGTRPTGTTGSARRSPTRAASRPPTRGRVFRVPALLASHRPSERRCGPLAGRRQRRRRLRAGDRVERACRGYRRFARALGVAQGRGGRGDRPGPAVPDPPLPNSCKQLTHRRRLPQEEETRPSNGFSLAPAGR